MPDTPTPGSRPGYLRDRIAAHWIADVSVFKSGATSPFLATFLDADGSARGFAVSDADDDDGRRSGVQRSARYSLRNCVMNSPPSPSARGDAFLLVVALHVPDVAMREDCRRWLDDEHAGRQLAVAGTSWFAGYESSTGPFNFLNLWGLTTPHVTETSAWNVARDTAWRRRLLAGAIAKTERSVFGEGPILAQQVRPFGPPE